MHQFNDRTSTLTIYTVKRPSIRACKTAPAIIMDKSCGFPPHINKAEDERIINETRTMGYLISMNCDYFRHGEITCSEENRHVSPGLLYYCLTDQAQAHIGANPNDYIYLPENSKRYLVLDYHPHPDDLLWKPYAAILSLNHTIFHFMALDSNGKLLTASIKFSKLAFVFEFNIIYPRQNERENYICRWCPADHSYGNRAPFHIHYELVFNTDPMVSNVARRIINYEAIPGLRSPAPIHNMRIYGREVHILD